MSTVIFACIMVLLVTFVVGVTAAGITQDQVHQCTSNPNPWCYQDWKCNDKNGNPVPMNSVASIIANCSPITAAQAAALNAAGHRNIYPGATCPASTPSCNLCTHVDTDTNCPPYGVGDINWGSCVAAKGFTPA